MDINTIDKSNMRETILKTYEQFSMGENCAGDLKVESKEFDWVCISGMGGSPMAGDILKSVELDPQIIINRDYNLPNCISEKSLVVALSYSGNTEETISTYEEALKRKANLIVISSGGKLEEKAKKDNVIFIKIPKPFPDFQPRYATGYIFGALTKVLSNSQAIKSYSEQLKELANKLKNQDEEQEGLMFAKKLKGKIPLFYASQKNIHIARIAKIKINENSKIPSFFNTFPEMNHNELVGFTNTLCSFYAIIFKDKDDQPQIQLRMDVCKNLFREKGIDTEEIQVKGNTQLEKIFLTLNKID